MKLIKKMTLAAVLLASTSAAAQTVEGELPPEIGH